MNRHYDQVRAITSHFLSIEPEVTQEKIRLTVDEAITRLEGRVDADAVDVDALCADLEGAFTIQIARGQFLDSDEESTHEEWLSDAGTRRIAGRRHLEWSFWRRYRQYLLDVKHWAPRVVNNLDDTTTKILQRLEDPLRPGAWDRRGMVVGAVQSGKTANFTGAICKAADAGYKVIVVLAGMHNNLRSQTQARLDREFFGQDSDKSRRYEGSRGLIGVGRVPGMGARPVVHTFTSSADNGDFKAAVANSLGFTPGSDPVFFVIKKHAGILENLNKWLRQIPDYDEQRQKISTMPLLVIDDECDQASINTRQVRSDDPDYDVTKINYRIRELLNIFDQSAYIGYTATPFANIFISPEAPHAEVGEDLFPRDFILNLPPPTNYVGPGRVFGIDADPRTGEPGADPQPVVVPVRSPEAYIPGRHKSDLVVRELPPSLLEAVHCFILSTALRRTRGQCDVHNTMLVHVSRFNSVQRQVADLLRELLKGIQNTLRFEDASGQRDRLLENLRSIWMSEYAPTTQAMRDGVTQPPWEDLRQAILTSAPLIDVKEVNGFAKDALDYINHESTGLHTIAVGGDKLSRGLTLEGLTVSYYLRAASMFDTLMQMGRWFGYRPNYEDLCRIFTTTEIMNLYRWIAMAEQELREDFDEMVRQHRTPGDFGLRVKRHPGGVLITSLTKQRSASRRQLTFSDDVPQTFTMDLRPDVLRRNIQAADAFVARLGAPSAPPRKPKSTVHYWSGVPSAAVLDFLEAYEMDERLRSRMTGRLLGDYIRNQNRSGKLTEWCIVVANPANAERDITLGGHKVHLVTRQTDKGLEPDVEKVTLNTLLDRQHESFDLTGEAYDRAMGATRRKYLDDRANDRIKEDKEEPTQPRPHDLRRERPPQRGLLILYAIDGKNSVWKDKAGRTLTRENAVIGWVISFPHDPDETTIEYTVNAVYEEEEDDL